MIIFAACAMFALATLVYVFWVPVQIEASPEKTRLAYLRERKDAVYDNLRDLNFEYKAGKLPEADYVSLRVGLLVGFDQLISLVEPRVFEVVLAELDFSNAKQSNLHSGLWSGVIRARSLEESMGLGNRF